MHKDNYRKFCIREKDIPIFSKDWWLDAVCGEENWDVVLVEKGGQIFGAMPFYLKNRFIFNYISMPLLTQTMGVFIKYPIGQKYYKKISWEKEIMDNLICQLPKFDYFCQNFHYSLSNWLPFYWNNFKQSTNYTYVIENICIEKLEELQTDIRRRRIRKAKDLGVAIIESEDIKTFYKLNCSTFKRKNMKIPYDFDFVQKLFIACKNNNAVKIFFAKYQDKFIASSFLVYDENTVYYLMGGIDPINKDLGAMDMLQFEGIKFALKSGRRFDFEGSMIENIEKYFRSFGAIQKPYFTITKINSKILKIRHSLKELLK